MTTSSRPRLDEFLLAVLWTLSAPIWGYFGIIGYFANVLNNDDFRLPGLILGYSFLCLMVFALRFSLNVYLRIPRNLPRWMDSVAPIVLGSTLFAGFIFSIVTMVIVFVHLFTEVTDNLIFAWGFAAAAGILILSLYELFAAVHSFEPFFTLWESRENHQIAWYLKWLMGLNALKRRVVGTERNRKRHEKLATGPLFIESDTKTTIIDEKLNGRPALEKTLVSHGGWHVTTLGFASNGSVIFAASDSGASDSRVVHFQAGGRKGTLFPPELKFWDWHTNKVQTATLGTVQTFLTTNSEIPASLINFRFLVATGGGKFVWVTPTIVRTCDWNNASIQELEPEGGLILRGYGGFSPVALSSEGSKFVWCDSLGQPSFWDMETDKTRLLRAYPDIADGAITGTEEGIWGLVFSPDGTKVAMLAKRGVMLQNVYTGWRWFAENNPAKEKLNSFAFNHNGFEMAVGLMAQVSAIRQPQTRRNRYNSSPAPTLPEGYTDANGQVWYSTVRLWDLRVADYADIIVGSSPLRELAYSPDNRMLVGVDEAGILRLWDIMPEGSLINPPRLVAQLELGMTGRKIVSIFSPDVERLICATDNRVLIWNLAKIRQEWAVPVKTT